MPHRTSTHASCGARRASGSDRLELGLHDGHDRVRHAVPAHADGADLER